MTPGSCGFDLVKTCCQSNLAVIAMSTARVMTEPTAMVMPVAPLRKKE